ncbi:MAG: hypothetical protein J0L66_10000 [Cytophagales bacterium]|nr:hypothetical protein [Cytophagales bacterium]
MKHIRNIKRITAGTLLALFLVAAAFANQPQHVATGKPVYQVSQVAALTLRDQNETTFVNLPAPVALTTPGWTASNLLQLKAVTHRALRIPAHAFNVFYLLVSIHAP